MCNLYRQRAGPQAIMDANRAMRSDVGTTPWEVAKELQRVPPGSALVIQ